MKYLMYFVLLLGVFEVVSNAFHLSKGTMEKAGQSAKKQHRELPLNLNDVHFFIKAIIMLVFGILFTSVGLVYIFVIEGNLSLALTSFALFGAYGLIQAIIYRSYLNVWPAALVYNIPLIIFLIIR